jgi:hypothetical protein
MTLEQFNEVLSHIYPNGGYVTEHLEGQEPTIKHLDDGLEPPTEGQIADAIAAIKAADYRKKRAEEYPTLQECIHALLDGGATLDELQALRVAVKAKYPKP